MPYVGSKFGASVTQPSGAYYDWWSPDLSIFQDAAGATPATDNDHPVARINTQTATGHNVVNTEGTTRPLLKTAFVNGHNAVLSDGANDYLQSIFNLNRPVTTIVAVHVVTHTVSARLIGDGSTNNFNMINCSGVSPEISFQAGGGAGAMNLASLAVGSWGVLSVRSDGAADNSMRHNLNARVTAGGDAGDLLTGITFFRHFTAALYSNAYLGWVAIYDSALDATAEAAAIQSFMTFYGIA